MEQMSDLKVGDECKLLVPNGDTVEGCVVVIYNGYVVFHTNWCAICTSVLKSRLQIVEVIKHVAFGTAKYMQFN